MSDSPRWCELCRTYGDHHTERCPHAPNAALRDSPEGVTANLMYTERVRAAGRDRTVHARTKDGDDIVRYDRSGKWYVEPAYAARKAVKLREAVTLALAGTVHLDKPGGQRFDAAYRKRAARTR